MTPSNSIAYILLSMAIITPTLGQDAFVVHDCDGLDGWTFLGNVQPSIQQDDRRENNRMLVLKYTGAGSFRVKIPLPQDATLTPWHVFSFQIRGASANAKARFWVHLICDNGARFRKSYRLSNMEWSEIFLLPLDFTGWERGANDKGEAPDWSRIQTVQFMLDNNHPDEQGNVLIDHLAFRKIVPRKADKPAPSADKIMIHNCDTTDGWAVHGTLEISTQTRDRPEGIACLRLNYPSDGIGSATIPVRPAHLNQSHVLALKLRGAWPTAEANVWLDLATDGEDAFSTKLDISRIDQWGQLLLVPEDFEPRDPRGRGAAPAEDFSLSDVRTLTFRVESPPHNAGGRVMVDDIAFLKMHTTGPGDAENNKHYWWWDGKYDPYLARHASESDWPHLQAQPQHTAPIKFDRFILSPYLPYTAYVHSDQTYDRATLTITDWQLNPIKVVSLDRVTHDVVPIELTAPAKPGTYLFNLERYARGSSVPERYQTGVMVLAKRLREPRGIWGLFAYMMHSHQYDHFDVLLDMFQAAGIMCLREDIRLPMAKPDEYDPRWDVSVRRNYYRQAKNRGISILALLSLYDHPEVPRSIGQNQFVPPERLERFLIDVEETTRTYKGLVDWYELGNEMNERDLDPYADLLKKTYAAAKRGDPDCKLTMGGCHSNDRWQQRLYQMEQAEADPRYKVYQDTVATHPYPAIWGVEPTLRYWLQEKIGVETLRAKGTLMTEAGWPALTRKCQALLRRGLLPSNFIGELDTQCWMGMYSSVMLGEYLKMGATLHGIYYFRGLTVLKTSYIFYPDGRYRAGELAMPSEGFFVEGNSNTVGWHVATVPRPVVYTHNTVARLLTHEVQLAEIDAEWDKAAGHLERYAFARPGETIVAMWIGPDLKYGYTGWGQELRAQSLDVTVTVPTGTALATATDLMGIERVLPIRNGKVRVHLTRPEDVTDKAGQIIYPRSGQTTWLRLFEGKRTGQVFVQKMPAVIGDEVEILAGTPHNNPQLVEEISSDRNLPTITDQLPPAGQAMVLYSRMHNSVYLLGRTRDDVQRARQTWRTIQP